MVSISRRGTIPSTHLVPNQAIYTAFVRRRGAGTNTLAACSMPGATRFREAVVSKFHRRFELAGGAEKLDLKISIS